MGVIKLDSEPVLENGTGTPFLAIYNGAEGAITNPKDNMPIGMLVTSFRYKYKEDGVDEGDFTIKTDNPNLPALDTLQYNKPLILQWGYIYPSRDPYFGPKRRVIIVDHQITWGQDGIEFKVGFASRGILLKNIPSSWRQAQKETEGYYEVLKEIVLKNRVVGVKTLDMKTEGVERKEVILKLMKDAPVDEPYQHIVTPSTRRSKPKANTRSNVKGIYEFLHDPSENPQETKKVLEIFNADDPEAQEYLARNKEYIEDPTCSFYFTKATLIDKRARSSIFVGSARNVWGQLEEYSNNLKNGPYFLDSRDDDVTIHNRDLNRPVTRVYTYFGGNGELLYFKVENKFTINYVDAAEDADIDPDTKDERVVWAQNISDPNTGLYVIHENGYTNVFARDHTFVSKNYEAISMAMTGKVAGYYTPDNMVSDPKSQELSTQQIFDSQQDAINYFQSNPGLTEEEFNQKMEEIQKIIREKVLDKTAWSKYTNDWDYFDSFIIKRKVRIKSSHNAAKHKWGTDTVPTNVPWDIGPKVAVESFLNGYASNRGLTVIGIETTNAGMVDPNTYLNNPDAYRLDITPTVYTADIQEVEVPLHAKHILASRPQGSFGPGMENQLRKSLDVSCRAQALFIGHPILESSMNLYIQNVSPKYSGIWYITEVEHSFSISGGYTCLASFIQRDITMSTSLVHTNINLRQKALDLQKEAKEVLDREGSNWDTVNQVEKELREKAEEAGGGAEGNTLKSISGQNRNMMFVQEESTEQGQVNLTVYANGPNITDAEKDFNLDYTSSGSYYDEGKGPTNILNNPEAQ